MCRPTSRRPLSHIPAALGGLILLAGAAGAAGAAQAAGGPASASAVAQAIAAPTALTLAAAASSGTANTPVITPTNETAPPVNASHPIQRSTDFDFFFGRWHVANRRLKHPLQGDGEWEAFGGIQICAPLLGGLANYDELLDTDGTPLGMSIHLFDLATRTWSSTWVSARDGAMQPPVRGRFHGGNGVFEGTDTLDGRPIQVRYTWSRTDTPTPRWEQAFSADGGKTWETNWVMDYSRIEEAR